MKKMILFTLLFLLTMLHAAPDGNYVFQLESATQAEIDANMGGTPQNGMMVYNTTDNKVYYYDGTAWINNPNPTVSTDVGNQIVLGTDGGAYLGSTVFTGSFVISANGNKIIAGLPFKPSQITFVAQANIESINIDTGSVDADANIDVFTGSMNGFARKDSASTAQQVMFTGHSGRETGSPYVNHTSKYASDANCIAIRYGDEEGAKIGMLTASLTSFNNDGFTINVTRDNAATSENLLVLFTAHK